MGLLDWLATSSTRSTISDDGRSRVARSQSERRMRIQPEQYAPNGDPMLWFDVSVSSLGGYPDVPIEWQADSEEHARSSFLEWLEQDEWKTVDVVFNGSAQQLTFRTSWVAGFTIGKGRRRRG